MSQDPLIKELGDLLGAYTDSRADYYWEVKELLQKGFYLKVQSPWPAPQAGSTRKILNIFAYHLKQSPNNRLFKFWHPHESLPDLWSVPLFADDTFEMYIIPEKWMSGISKDVTPSNILNQSMKSMDYMGQGPYGENSAKYSIKIFFRLKADGASRTNAEQLHFDEKEFPLRAQKLKDELKSRLAEAVRSTVRNAQLSQKINKKKNKLAWSEEVEPILQLCHRLGYRIQINPGDDINEVRRQMEAFPSLDFGVKDLFELNELKKHVLQSQYRFGNDQVIGAWKNKWKKAILDTKEFSSQNIELLKSLTTGF